MRLPLDEERRQKIRKSIESLAKLAFRCVQDKYHSNVGRQKEYHSIESLRDAIFSKEMDNEQSNRDYYLVLEAITLLERRGLVVRDLPSNLRSMGKDHFIVYLTSIGIKSKIDDEVILLVDKPEEIVGALEQKVGNLDEIIRQYYLESLRAYQEGLYISSVICLGAASERATRWLAESIDPYAGTYQQGIRQRRNGNISRLIDYLSNTVIPNTFDDKKFKEKLKERLNGLGNVYRENRNDAGHPDTVEQNSWLGEDQEVLLLQFRRYITTICEAIERLKKQSVS